MEDDASRPESEIGPEKPEGDLKGRLEELEREAKRLREQLSSPQPAASGEAATPAQDGPVEPEEKPADLPPPTREQLEKAERLIQFARLAKTRGQSGQANTYLHQAEEACPNSPIVLEFVGDLFLDQKRFKDARAVYKRAFDLDPKNIGLERKWAKSIAAIAPTVDPLAFSAEAVASSRSATFLSGFIPGLGQIVLGEIGKGIGIMVVWLGMLFWVIGIPRSEMIDTVDKAGVHHSAPGLVSDNIRGIIGLVNAQYGHNEPFHPVVLVPLFIMFVLWIGAMFDAKMSTGIVKQPVARPIPLDDRPFE